MAQTQEQAAAESYAAVEAALRAAARQAQASGDAKTAGSADAAGDQKTIALTAVFTAWRRGVKALVGDMVSLAAAESKLAAVGAVQFLLGALIVVSFGTLALLWLEMALAAILYSLALSPLLIALLLCALNVLLAYIVVGMLKPLTANFSFEHTRQVLSKADAHAAAANMPEPAKPAAQTATAANEGS